MGQLNALRSEHVPSVAAGRGWGWQAEKEMARGEEGGDWAVRSGRSSQAHCGDLGFHSVWGGIQQGALSISPCHVKNDRFGVFCFVVLVNKNCSHSCF